MAVDLKLELFAHDLFSKIFFENKLRDKICDGRVHYSDECMADIQDHQQQIYDDYYYQAVVCRQCFYRRIYYDEFSEHLTGFTATFSDFCDYVHIICDRKDLFGNMHLFDHMLASCAFIADLCLFCHSNGHENFIRIAHLCWALYYDNLSKEFYDQGGWESFHKVAFAYSLPFSFLTTHIEPRVTSCYIFISMTEVHFTLTNFLAFLNFRLKRNQTDTKDCIEFRREKLDLFRIVAHEEPKNAFLVETILLHLISLFHPRNEISQWHIHEFQSNFFSSEDFDSYLLEDESKSLSSLVEVKNVFHEDNEQSKIKLQKSEKEPLKQKGSDMLLQQISEDHVLQKLLELKIENPIDGAQYEAYSQKASFTADNWVKDSLSKRQVKISPLDARLIKGNTIGEYQGSNASSSLYLQMNESTLCEETNEERKKNLSKYEIYKTLFPLDLNTYDKNNKEKGPPSPISPDKSFGKKETVKDWLIFHEVFMYEKDLKSIVCDYELGEETDFENEINFLPPVEVKDFSFSTSFNDQNKHSLSNQDNEFAFQRVEDRKEPVSISCDPGSQIICSQLGNKKGLIFSNISQNQNEDCLSTQNDEAASQKIDDYKISIPINSDVMNVCLLAKQSDEDSKIIEGTKSSVIYTEGNESCPDTEIQDGNTQSHEDREFRQLISKPQQQTKSGNKLKKKNKGKRNKNKNSEEKTNAALIAQTGSDSSKNKVKNASKSGISKELSETETNSELSGVSAELVQKIGTSFMNIAQMSTFNSVTSTEAAIGPNAIQNVCKMMKSDFPPTGKQSEFPVSQESLNNFLKTIRNANIPLPPESQSKRVDIPFPKHPYSKLLELENKSSPFTSENSEKKAVSFIEKRTKVVQKIQKIFASFDKNQKAGGETFKNQCLTVPTSEDKKTNVSDSKDEKGVSMTSEASAVAFTSEENADAFLCGPSKMKQIKRGKKHISHSIRNSPYQNNKSNEYVSNAIKGKKVALPSYVKPSDYVESPHSPRFTTPAQACSKTIPANETELYGSSLTENQDDATTDEKVTPTAVVKSSHSPKFSTPDPTCSKTDTVTENEPGGSSSAKNKDVTTGGKATPPADVKSPHSPKFSPPETTCRKTDAVAKNESYESSLAKNKNVTTGGKASPLSDVKSSPSSKFPTPVITCSKTVSSTETEPYESSLSETKNTTTGGKVVLPSYVKPPVYVESPPSARILTSLTTFSKTDAAAEKEPGRSPLAKNKDATTGGKVTPSAYVKSPHSNKFSTPVTTSSKTDPATEIEPYVSPLAKIQNTTMGGKVAPPADGNNPHSPKFSPSMSKTHIYSKTDTATENEPYGSLLAKNKDATTSRKVTEPADVKSPHSPKFSTPVATCSKTGQGTETEPYISPLAKNQDTTTGQKVTPPADVKSRHSPKFLTSMRTYRKTDTATENEPYGSLLAKNNDTTTSGKVTAPADVKSPHSSKFSTPVATSSKTGTASETKSCGSSIAENRGATTGGKATLPAYVKPPTYVENPLSPTFSTPEKKKRGRKKTKKSSASSVTSTIPRDQNASCILSSISSTISGETNQPQNALPVPSLQQSANNKNLDHFSYLTKLHNLDAREMNSVAASRSNIDCSHPDPQSKKILNSGHQGIDSASFSAECAASSKSTKKDECDSFPVRPRNNTVSVTREFNESNQDPKLEEITEKIFVINNILTLGVKKKYLI